MPRYTRGEFLGVGATLAAALGLGQVPGGGNAPPGGGDGGALQGNAEPDLALINGRIFTVDDAGPRAEAFAVKNGRFIAVGAATSGRNTGRRNCAGCSRTAPSWITGYRFRERRITSRVPSNR